MPINILMPALSPTMEKGNLARWLKKEGDPVKSGDVLAEIETDKATMEVEAVDEGVLAKIVVPEGAQDVPVNEIIGLIAADGEDAKAVSTGGGKSAASSAPAPQPSEAKGNGSVPSPSAPTEPAPPAHAAAPAGHNGARIFVSPLARRLAKQAGVDLAMLKGSGPHGRIIE